MRLFLAQHGEALAKEIDPERPLSPRGQADVEAVAALLLGHVEVARVVHSGKTRARQSAELLAAKLAPERPVEQLDGLSPKDPTAPFAQRLVAAAEDQLVVGHLPFVGRLMSRLVTGAEEPPIAAFSPGTVVCLELGDAERWRILWMVRPELLQR